jgi:hypothetical protein
VVNLLIDAGADLLSKDQVRALLSLRDSSSLAVPLGVHSLVAPHLMLPSNMRRLLSLYEAEKGLCLSHLPQLTHVSMSDGSPSFTLPSCSTGINPRYMMNESLALPHLLVRVPWSR